MKEETPYASVGQKYFKAFSIYARERISRLSISFMGDYNYEPKNTSSFKHKQKIFSYLRTKYVTTLSEQEEEEKKKFTNYDPNLGMGRNFQKLSEMKDCILRLNTNIEAAQDKLSQLMASRKFIKSNFFNEIAYEFDKQRYCSMAWGLMVGALICSTIYRKGRITRQAALFLACGHGMGQISYHWNIDKYFDTIYPIFEEDAIEFEKMESQEIQKTKTSDSAGIIEN